MDNQQNNEKIIPTIVEEEMKKNYIDYAMSVIMGRALPDVRDGLKPVQRRILYAMLEIGLLPNKPFKKCATIVGNVMAKYHPHGDIAIYDTLVRMAQDFSFRYPLIDGQGNFGSLDGDSAAAMRYTEARLSKTGLLMLEDIDKETVEFVPNFDASLKEPVVLPSKIPNLIVNGANGIAVGMTTNIPPHNLSEVINGLIAMIDKADISEEELLEYVKGPDFPTGGIILEGERIKEIYKKGYGKINVRAHTKIEDDKIIITDVPPSVNKALLVKDIAEAVKSGKVNGIRDLRDESNREGIRIVIEIGKNNPDLILNQLYRHTPLETSVHIKLLALDGKKPRIFSFRELMKYYLEHRKEIVKKRTEYLLKKSSERLNIVNGLIIAINNIDQVIEIIKKSKDSKEAMEKIIGSINLNKEQAKAVLDMKLSRLTTLERDGLEKEKKELEKTIEEYKEILSSEKNIMGVVKKELEEVMKSIGKNDVRRTEITNESSFVEDEEIIPDKEIVVMLTNNDYVKTVSLEEFREQNRGGKGLMIAKEDSPRIIEVANNKDYLLFFTDKGKVYWKKAYYLPETSRYGSGRHISNILEMDKDERIVAIINSKLKDIEEKTLLFATKKGIGKRVSIKEFINPRRGGKKAINIREDDSLIDVIMPKKELVIVSTKNGRSCVIRKEDLRIVGRNAYGYRIIKLKDEDEVISISSVDKEDYVLTVTSKGYGRVTKVEEYRITARGSVGVLNLGKNKEIGKIVSVIRVGLKDSILLFTEKKAIRFPVESVRISGRTSKGVRLINMEDGEEVIGLTRIEGD